MIASPVTPAQRLLTLQHPQASRLPIRQLGIEVSVFSRHLRLGDKNLLVFREVLQADYPAVTTPFQVLVFLSQT